MSGVKMPAEIKDFVIKTLQENNNSYYEAAISLDVSEYTARNIVQGFRDSFYYQTVRKLEARMLEVSDGI